MSKKSILSYLAFLLVIVSSSYYSCVKDVGLLPVPKVVSFCDSLNVTWSVDIQPIIQTQCISPGCHDPASGNYSGYDLTTYLLVKAKADAGRIRARVIEGTTNGWMPSTGPLPVSDREKIDCWLKEGALEN